MPYILKPDLYEYDSASEALEAATKFNNDIAYYLSYIVASRDLGETYFVNVFDSRNQSFKGSVWPKDNA